MWSDAIAKHASSLTCLADRVCRSNTVGFEFILQPSQKFHPLASLGPWSLAWRDGKIECRQYGKVLGSLNWEPVVGFPHVMSKSDKKNHGQVDMIKGNIALAYSYGRKELMLYLNGKHVSFKVDHQEMDEFAVYGLSKTQYMRNAFWYFSARTPEQIDVLFQARRVSKSSLALFAPLDDRVFAKEAPLMNFAPTGMGFVESK